MSGAVKKQTGHNLIELMIAVLLGVVITAAVMTIYIRTAQGGSDVIKSARLNYDLEMILSVMMNDIRRAGYWGGAIASSDARENPFMGATSNLAMPRRTCILYSYDDDGDGSVDDDEYYGFKLEESSIRMRLTGATTADCSNGNWHSLKSSEIKITQLEFSLSPILATPATPALPESTKCFNMDTQSTFYTPCGAVADLSPGQDAVETRQVNIIIAGELVDDADVRKTLTGSIKVRNDRIFTKE